MATPASAAVTGNVATSTRHPQPPITFSARGQRRSAAGWENAAALAMA